MVKWHLAELMAQYRIKGTSLAEYVGKTETSISRLRKSKSVPKLSGSELNKLLDGLNILADPETKERDIDVADLISYKFERTRETSEGDKCLAEV